MSGTLSRSFQLFRESYNFVKQDRQLLLLPLFSVAIIFGVSGLLIYLLNLFMVRGDFNLTTFFWVIASIPLLYFLLFFSVMFFSAALVVCAKNKIDKKNPSIWQGINLVARQRNKLLKWVLISSTLGIFLSISKNSKRLERILVPSAKLEWSLLSFFTLPVLLFEDLDVYASIKRSGMLFKNAWGKSAVGFFSLTAVMWVFILIALLPLFSAFALQVGSPIIGAVATLILLALVGSFSAAFKEVYVAVLYTYATKGIVNSNFDRELVKHAFAPARTK